MRWDTALQQLIGKMGCGVEGGGGLGHLHQLLSLLVHAWSGSSYQV